MERKILHCDLNNFYASVECMLNPELSGKPVAVCGNVELRHGIILAKNELAKSYGIKTGEPLWQAVQKCPGLISVSPHMERYDEYSKKAIAIYSHYTDLIESFGIDECWLDVTGSQRLYGDGEIIAHKIREQVKEELKITISVGVSFNKTFAKLGSDYQKPDAVTVISPDNYKEIVWPLPVEELLYVGPATKRTLNRCGIFTIGQLAAVDPAYLCKKLGKNGDSLSTSARGKDCGLVQKYGFHEEEKSIGNGLTAPFDLETTEQVSALFLSLAECVGRRLRRHGMQAGGISVTIKNNLLQTYEIQRQLPSCTDITNELWQYAVALFQENYHWKTPVRALTLRTYNLCRDPVMQGDLFTDFSHRIKSQKIDRSVDTVRQRFGVHAVLRASLLHNPLDRVNAYSNEGHPWAHIV